MRRVLLALLTQAFVLGLPLTLWADSFGFYEFSGTFTHAAAEPEVVRRVSVGDHFSGTAHYEYVIPPASGGGLACPDPLCSPTLTAEYSLTFSTTTGPVTLSSGPYSRIYLRASSDQFQLWDEVPAGSPNLWMVDYVALGFMFQNGALDGSTFPASLPTSYFDDGYLEMSILSSETGPVRYHHVIGAIDSIHAVPEPASFWLLGLSLLALGVYSRHR
jgi:hypothetical protein